MDLLGRKKEENIAGYVISMWHVEDLMRANDLDMRKVETALAQGDFTTAQSAFAAAEPEIRRGVTKGVLHMNTASRKISRLSRRVKALAPTDLSA